jgi:hypothetical protein
MEAVTRRCDLDDCPTGYDFRRNRWRLCRRATNCEFADAMDLDPYRKEGDPGERLTVKVK